MGKPLQDPTTLPWNASAQPIVNPVATAEVWPAAAAKPASATSRNPAKKQESISPVMDQHPESPEATISAVQSAKVQPAVVLPVIAAPHRSTSIRYYLKSESPIVDAPSIGPKTAARFNAIGMYSVEEFLNADAESTAAKLAVRHITLDVIREWQAQAKLIAEVPGLRDLDAQLLVASNVEISDQLRDSDVVGLLDAVTAVTTTSLGKSILRE